MFEIQNTAPAPVAQADPSAILARWLRARREEDRWFTTDHRYNWHDVNIASHDSFGAAPEPMRSDADGRKTRLDPKGIVRVVSQSSKRIEVVEVVRTEELVGDEEEGFEYVEEEVEVTVRAVEPVADRWGHLLDYATIEENLFVVYAVCLTSDRVPFVDREYLGEILDRCDEEEDIPEVLRPHIQRTELEVSESWDIHTACGEEDHIVYTGDLDPVRLAEFAREHGLFPDDDEEVVQ